MTAIRYKLVDSRFVYYDTADFTPEQREEYIAGWIDGGGRTDDINDAEPFCKPWTWQDSIIAIPSSYLSRITSAKLLGRYKAIVYRDISDYTRSLYNIY